MPKYIIKSVEDLPDLLTIWHSARILGCHTNTLRNWERDWTIEAIRIWNRKDRRFRKSAIMDIVNNNENAKVCLNTR